MIDTIRIHPSVPIPPIVLTPVVPRRVRDADPLPRLARIACALAALALPALGIAAADTVHRAGAAPAMWAAASNAPSTGTASAFPGSRHGGRP